MADKQYDRSTQDLGNIVNLGHVNVCITDQHLATHYYVTGLGLTRDPFLNTGARLMWINVGMSQFHLPNGQPDVLRGVTGLVVPDRAALLDRLSQVRKPLEGTKFDFRESNDCVETVCPWGNRINVHAPDESRFGRIILGMPYIEFDVRPGTADRIARFYRDVMGALAAVVENGGARKTRVQVGEKQYWYFRETDEPERPYDRHHAQIYMANFSGPYRRLKELGLLTMEVNDYERHRSGYPRSAVHRGARGPQPDASAPWPAAGQSQPGAEQPRLQARPRQHVVGDSMSRSRVY
jgi:hypothetical protein